MLLLAVVKRGLLSYTIPAYYPRTFGDQGDRDAPGFLFAAPPGRLPRCRARLLHSPVDPALLINLQIDRPVSARPVPQQVNNQAHSEKQKPQDCPEQ